MGVVLYNNIHVITFLFFFSQKDSEMIEGMKFSFQHMKV